MEHRCHKTLYIISILKLKKGSISVVLVTLFLSVTLSCRRIRSSHTRNGLIAEIENAQRENKTSMSSSIWTRGAMELLIPTSPDSFPNQVLKRIAYITSYNSSTRNPNWVAWHLTAEHSDGAYARPSGNAFHEDEEVSRPRATLEDYKGSGWSRGHMCPAGDNKWDADAMYESFLLTNVCLQDSRLNSGLWNSLEIDCRRWAKQFGDIYIVCGPVYYRQKHEKIGENNISVPEAFFKIVLCLNGKPKGLGIVVKNNAGTKKSDLYYNSIDQVERITGMDFFPGLPDDIENALESESDINEWN